MRMLVLALAVALAGCSGDLGSEPSAIQQQQIQRSFYAPGNPAANNPPPADEPQREAVPGEVVPDR